MFHLVKHKFCGICTTEFRTANEDWFYEHMLQVHDIKFPYVTFFDSQKSRKLKCKKSRTKCIKNYTKTKATEKGIILSLNQVAAVISLVYCMPHHFDPLLSLDYKSLLNNNHA